MGLYSCGRSFMHSEDTLSPYTYFLVYPVHSYQQRTPTQHQSSINRAEGKNDGLWFRSVENIRILPHLIRGSLARCQKGSQTAFCIPQQHLIQRIQLSHLGPAGRSLLPRISSMNRFSFGASLFPCSCSRPRRFSTMPFTNAFSSGCGYPTLLSCTF